MRPRTGPGNLASYLISYCRCCGLEALLLLNAASPSMVGKCFPNNEPPARHLSHLAGAAVIALGLAARDRGGQR
jgi:hypothetical protein